MRICTTDRVLTTPYPGRRWKRRTAREAVDGVADTLREVIKRLVLNVKKGILEEHRAPVEHTQDASVRPL